MLKKHIHNIKWEWSPQFWQDPSKHDVQYLETLQPLFTSPGYSHYCAHFDRQNMICTKNMYKGRLPGRKRHLLLKGSSDCNVGLFKKRPSFAKFLPVDLHEWVHTYLDFGMQWCITAQHFWKLKMTSRFVSMLTVSKPQNCKYNSIKWLWRIVLNLTRRFHPQVMLLNMPDLVYLSIFIVWETVSSPPPIASHPKCPLSPMELHSLTANMHSFAESVPCPNSINQ